MSSDRLQRADVLILLAAYNGAEYLRDQIESICRQSFTSWRLLVRDDHSPDGTARVVRELAEHDDRIELLTDHRGRLGVLKNFAALAEAAIHRPSRYIAFCDQDDVWHPDKLAWQVTELMRAEQTWGPYVPLALHTDLEVVDARLKLLHPSFLQYQGLRHEAERPLRTLVVQNFVTGNTLLVNRPLLELAVPLPAEALVHDWWFALCAAAAGKLAFLDRPTVYYRQHGGNTIGAKRWLSARTWTKLFEADRWRRLLGETVQQADALRRRLEERGLDAPDQQQWLQEYVALFGLDSRVRRIRRLRQLGARRQSHIRNALLLTQACLAATQPLGESHTPGLATGSASIAPGTSASEFSTALRPLFVIGTRPEAIKLAPLLAECRRRPGQFAPRVCFTGQHRDMVRPIAEHFGIVADYELDAMQSGQSLSLLLARILEGLDRIIANEEPDCIIAQGDTTSVLAAGLAAFHRRIPLVHVEAGLRTGDLHRPWPEEFNRRIATLAATLHCAPTQQAAENLLRAGVHRDNIRVTGNTVVDALLDTVERVRADADRWQARHAGWYGRRMVLVTCHRRENLGSPLSGICQAVSELAARFPDTAFVWPVHPNPDVRSVVTATLGNTRGVYLIPPAEYPEFVWLMDQSSLILTDSGGVQEEAPSLGKPVLVLRHSTERPEAAQCGAVELVGHRPADIVARASALLSDDARLNSLHARYNPFGDGRASQRIADLMLQHLGARNAATRQAA